MTTELSFPQPWIEQWAEFSGDRNPIHFDAGQARRLGSADVIAHGMLVLLFVKETLSRALPAVAAGEGWLSFRSRLRNPVVRNEPTVLEMVPRREGLAFTLTGQGRPSLITGSLAPTATPQGPDESIHRRLRLAADRVRERAERLTTAFPAIAAPWVVADAVTFATFLETGLRDFVAAYGMNITPGDWSPLSQGDRLVVQTRHDVDFHAGFFARGTDVTLDLDLVVESGPPVVTLVGDNVSATTTLFVRSGKQPVMAVKIGLLMVPTRHLLLVQD
jgi:hypothetical protein